MKKFILGLLISLCSITFLWSQKVEIDEAINVAKNFENTKKIFKESIILAHSTPYYYVFINEANNAFIIIGGYKQIYPILAYSTESGFDANYITPPVEWYLNGIESQAKMAILDPDATERFKEAWHNTLKIGHPETKDIQAVGPLLSTIWDQGCYYNALCPVDPNGPCGHVWAGCVATSMGQIMRYHKYPTSGIGTPSYASSYGNLTVKLDTVTYDYDDMPNQLNAHVDSIPTAKLLYHCGITVEMGYGPDGSGAQSSKAALAFQNYFKYPDYVQYVSRGSMDDDGWGSILKIEIDAGRPIYYSGGGLPGEAGHAFVCDGYDGPTHFHFNWGWGGYLNGYFYLNNLKPGGNDFTNGQDIIIGVEPAEDDQVYCDELTILTDESGVIEDGSGEARYGNNSSCSWIIKPESQPASIVLKVEELALEEESDYVVIRAGESSTGPLIAYLTGHTLPSPNIYYIMSPSVYIQFYSNETLRDYGFKISYESGDAINLIDNINLSIYPNPASDIIFVETNEKIINVNIFNNLGQSIFEQNYESQSKIQINIDNINPGIYIIEVETISGFKTRKPINIY
ncbi:MAG: C10 family peptidase [Bacteroidales bacterium]